MKIAGIFWSRLAGPLVGIAAFFALAVWIEGYSGIFLGFFAFGLCGWLGEKMWWNQASTDERRADLEDRVRNPLD